MAAAVRTNRPAPMIPPMPSATKFIQPKERLSVCSPTSSASCIKRSSGFFLNRFAMISSDVVGHFQRRRRSGRDLVEFGSASSFDGRGHFSAKQVHEFFLWSVRPDSRLWVGFTLEVKERF